VFKRRVLDGRAIWRLTQQEETTRDVVVAISQAKAALAPWVAQLRFWDLYATFTYDPAKFEWNHQATVDFVRPPSNDASRRHMSTYLGHLQDELGREIGAFCALETTKRGWPHWHGLIACGGLDSDEFTSASRLWFENRGYAKFTRVDAQDPTAVATYVSKYIVKEKCEVLLWGRLAGKAQPGQLRLPIDSRKEQHQ